MLQTGMLVPATPRPATAAALGTICGPCSPRGTREQFAHLPEGRVRILDRQQSLFWEGDEATQFFQVVDGMICLSTMLADGRRQVLRFCTKGDVFGLAPTGDYDCTAIALTASSVTAHRLSDLDRPDGRPNPLASAVLRTIYRDLASAQDQVLMLGRKTAVEKVASFLISLARRAGVEKRPGIVSVPLPMKLTDIGDHLGLAAETICRLMAQFRKRGLVAHGKAHWLDILDFEALEEVAEAESLGRAA